jgi:hypothetical protein
MTGAAAPAVSTVAATAAPIRIVSWVDGGNLFQALDTALATLVAVVVTAEMVEVMAVTGFHHSCPARSTIFIGLSLAYMQRFRLIGSS